MSVGGSSAPSWRGGVVLMAVLLAVAIAAPWLAPYPPNEMLDLIALKSRAPSASHPFGTDAFSRDVLSRVLFGARVSLGFALSAVSIALTVGTLYGAAMAFAPSAIATLLRRLLDIALSVPRLLVLLAVAGVSGPLPVTMLVLLMGLTGWYAVARLVADELSALATRDFSLAARATGVQTVRLFTHHLLPHLAPMLMISGAFSVASTIGLEAGLSFLGLGIQPPTASWGNILRDGAGGGAVPSEWWLTVFPGLATVLPVLACNAVGDALRDRFAPVQFAESAPRPSVALSPQQRP
ncbi:ABC transporter permease [Gemmatimonas sp.]|uniref:ABC transporter permease n=1 Tax=Gemmatimonas sp. TaxID=1962908 RepID=UPI003F705641